MKLRKVCTMLVLKYTTFNLPNDHATSWACLNDRAIMVNFRSMCQLKCVIERVSNFQLVQPCPKQALDRLNV